MSIFENSLNRSLFNNPEYYRLLFKVCDYYKRRYDQLSLESHAKIIKFMLTQAIDDDKEHFDSYIKKILK
jgi:5-hydroxyisourate hydrolase-like protein (transthyretin family)